MGIREREGLITRVRQIRRAATGDDPPPSLDPSNPELNEVNALEARVAHLEGLLQGLQDSVHRESLRQSKRIAELEARVDPAALAVALSKDARDRGL